jgi:hypothetical protein
VYTEPAIGNARDICVYELAVNIIATMPTR